MLALLFFIFILICIAIVVAYLYSTSEMPDIPDWEELESKKEKSNSNG